MKPLSRPKAIINLPLNHNHTSALTTISYQTMSSVFARDDSNINSPFTVGEKDSTEVEIAKLFFAFGIPVCLFAGVMYVLARRFFKKRHEQKNAAGIQDLEVRSKILNQPQFVYRPFSTHQAQRKTSAETLVASPTEETKDSGADNEISESLNGSSIALNANSLITPPPKAFTNAKIYPDVHGQFNQLASTVNIRSTDEVLPKPPVALQKAGGASEASRL